jgi:hypothetical protein
VKLNEDTLTETDKRYATARVEIQVASVLMHAWSEVDHDLAYKSFTGDLSEDEIASLNQLNLLVHFGEIELERLQKAIARRIDKIQRPFRNHFELATHLLQHFSATSDRPVSDSGLGRVDQLFEFLAREEINTPEKLVPYLAVLNGDLESRSLAAQVVDAVLTDRPELYAVWREVQAQSRRWGSQFDEHGIYPMLGEFMARWTELERLIREHVPADLASRPLVQLLYSDQIVVWLGRSLVARIDRLRHDRNEIVHPRKGYPDQTYLIDSLERLNLAIADIIDRPGEQP